ncbi:MAG TPA: DNA polymerase III subunit alpha [Bacilli bacterium]|nr:MAG: DNA polymerase III subunit alpha [Tenericutes bacterium ADurb.BinA124]HNZ50585.1 DNA polymerase III subunit alpha [Bacilli bacterium]HPX84110.1 DNA polymerase III subunit alpha [Bacilli bacterium]
MKFVNLYIETEYSMLRSLVKIDSLIHKAKADNQQVLAICDFEVMHGAMKFYFQCLDNRLKPIIGLKITLVVDGKSDSLLLYAKNIVGYRHLMKLSTHLKTNGPLDVSTLSQNAEGLLAILPSDENSLMTLLPHKPELAGERLHLYKQMFADLFFGIDGQTEANRVLIPSLLSFAHQYQIRPVAIHRTSYLEPDDFSAYQTLRCIDLAMNEYPYSEKELSQWFLTQEQAFDKFHAYEELISNTEVVAQLCDLRLEFGRYQLPVFPDSLGQSFSYLTDLAKLGLNKRLKNTRVDVEKYKARLFYELEIINKMGYCDYFLIVYDFIKFAKKNKILVGPGRGSGPSSLVSYVLGITDIDPLKFDLLFERFLNPERISMPDIDTDFPDNRRDEIIQYVKEKYGTAKVAHISTFGTFGVRLALRDVARVLRLPDVVLQEVLKFIPSADASLENILQENAMFANLVKENPQVKKLIDLVAKLEGLPRHISTHAAGIVMTKEDLVEFTPLQVGMNGLYQTQYEAMDLEKIGLVKIDFLGLRNLTIIDNVINKIHQTNPDFEILKIPLDDKPTYRMIAAGDTDGIFQLESRGMRNVLVGLKTSDFMDIVNANALFRPGPMEMIPSFIKRKFNEEAIDYLHPDLQTILEPTYGIIVFQEQIMLIAQKFAGYTLGMADILRRAVSKKTASVLENERERFVRSALKKGYDEITSQKVYDYIVKFANYGFNKSHSVAYSLIAYQMAYLKRHYYQHFMSELMTNSIGSVALIKSYIDDCAKKKIVVKGPSVNFSEDYFVVKNNVIYYSLLGIQNLGVLTLNNFLNERKTNGLYQSYDDFIGRTKDILNRRVVESMIFAGALDEFAIPRKQMVLEYDNSLSFATFSSLLHGRLTKRTFQDEEYSFEEISKLEKEALGFNLKYSIFNKYLDFKAKNNLVNLNELSISSQVRAVFAIRRVKPIITKNNETMAFLEIYDDNGRMDGVLFPKVYERYQNLLHEGRIFLGEGSLEERQNKKQFVLRNLRTLE